MAKYTNWVPRFIRDPLARILPPLTLTKPSGSVSGSRADRVRNDGGGEGSGNVVSDASKSGGSGNPSSGKDRQQQKLVYSHAADGDLGIFLNNAGLRFDRSSLEWKQFARAWYTLPINCQREILQAASINLTEGATYTWGSFELLVSQMGEYAPKRRVTQAVESKSPGQRKGSPQDGRSRSSDGVRENRPESEYAPAENYAEGAPNGNGKPKVQMGNALYAVIIVVLLLGVGGMWLVRSGLVTLPSVASAGPSYDDTFGSPALPPEFSGNQGGSGAGASAALEKEMAIASLVPVCQDGGYYARLSSPADEVVQNQERLCEDVFCDQRTGPVVTVQQAWVIEMVQRSGTLIVPVGLTAYYAPASYYPEVGGEVGKCMPKAETLGVEQRISALLPKEQMISVHPSNFMFPVLIGLSLIFNLALVYEAVTKNRLPVIVGVVVLSAGLLLLQSFVEKTAAGQLTYFVVGTLAFLALGFRESAMGQVREIIDRTKDVDIPGDLRALTAKGGGWNWVLNWTEWSYITVWVGLNAGVMVLSPQNAAFSYIAPPAVAVAILALIALTAILLESGRRGSKEDFLIPVIALAIGVIFTIIPIVAVRFMGAGRSSVYTAELVFALFVVGGAMFMSGSWTKIPKYADRAADLLQSSTVFGVLGVLAGVIFGWY